MASGAYFYVLYSTMLLTALLNLGLAIPAPHSTTPDPPLHRRRLDMYSALGDSFAAGIAAGTPYDEDERNDNLTCGRYNGAYGVKLRDNRAVMSTQFQFLACSGSTIRDVRRGQLGDVHTDDDLVTVTIGGNNVDWHLVVNACVYRFDGPRAGDCNEALDNTGRLINDPTVVFNPLLDTIQALVTKTLTTKIYVTGYAKFWNQVTTQCDNVSWNFWWTPGASKMTRGLRQRMNDLLLQLNAQIRGAVLAAGSPRVFFVDYDGQFEGHRFCEEGVTEPQRRFQSRPNTWFFQFNTPIGSFTSANDGLTSSKSELPNNNAINGAQAGDASNANLPASSPDDNIFVPPTFPANVFYDMIQAARAASPDLEVNPIYAGANITVDHLGQIPMSLTKIFHPTSPGHAQIANTIATMIGVPLMLGGELRPKISNSNLQ
ncbi:hypothetical protein GP486_005137 [Trichoglossum hirsutum]|uniref:SGNH hydrolase-type esterase domain-containing protein n=1 Tax=Trichoglossum hirsutum TaxID=265104 RepID=A0A9P8L9Z2_9PEZI|nr:hypothetical protein GP486_005137 [Trichoglossum hirsutum]